MDDLSFVSAQSVKISGVKEVCFFLVFLTADFKCLGRKRPRTQAYVLEKLIFERKHSPSPRRPFLKPTDLILLLPVVFVDVFPRSAGEATTCSNNPVHLTQPPLCALTLSAAVQ